MNTRNKIARPLPDRLSLWAALALLLLVATWLGIHYPNHSLWYDEALTTYVATDSWQTLWQWCTEVDIQVPFHYVALRLWAALLGQSEFALRLLSALAVLLAVAAVVACGRLLSKRRIWLGHIAALLFGLLPGLLWVAYEVRAYAWGLALYLWATAFLLRLLIVPIRGRRWWLQTIGYGLLMTGALYTHYTALAGFVAHGLLVAVVILTLLGRWLRAKKLLWLAMRPALPIMIAALCFAPWLPVLLARSGSDRSFYSGSIPPLQSAEVLFGFKVLGRQDSPLAALPLIAVYLLLVSMGLVGGVMLKQTRRAVLSAALLAIVPAAITIALLVVNPKLTGRYFWPAWLGLDLLVAASIVIISQWRLALAAVIALAGVLYPYSTGERGESPRSDYRGVFATICTEGTPDDVILLRDGTLFVVAAYYGNRPPCQQPRKVYGLPEALITNVTQMANLGEAQGLMAKIAADAPPNVWVVSWQGDVMDPQGLAYGLLDLAGKHTLAAAMYGDVRLDRYQFTNPTAHAGLAQLARQGPMPDAQWFNLTPISNGPRLIATRLLAPSKAKVGDLIVIQAWWERGAETAPSLRASARITTTDNGWLYTQVDQPPSSWKNYDERWPSGIPVLGRYELRINDDVPAGKISIRFVLYDTLGQFEPIVLTLAELEVSK
jgi:mannosyltransferase